MLAPGQPGSADAALETASSGALVEGSERVLTEEQQSAVARRRGPLALSAAAGSGKTAVLVERFVAAVREDDIAPAQILAITFTDRAAAELRERVRARLLALGDRAAARDTEAAFVSTFHGFCARLLRAHALQAGVDPDFEILDEGLAGRLRMRAFARALGELVQGGEREPVELAAVYGAERLRAMIEAAHAVLRSRGERVPRLPEAYGEPPAAVRSCAQLARLLAGFDTAYEQAKRRRAALDFDDLELLARDLLERDQSVRTRWSERFELLMVDEFQDTNQRQLEILRALERENLFTVGDELQAIYGFRHADVRLFRARNAQLEVSGAALALTSNFRSREALLEVIATVFEGRLPGFHRPLAARTEHGTGAGRGALACRGAAAAEAPAAVELLLADRSGWSEQPDLAREIAAGLPRAALWRQAEARMLARRVRGLVDAGHPPGGIAVLLRALGDIHVYERALAQAGLRTIAAAGAFWQHQQVEDLIAYLRALANPLDELALFGALASPLCAPPDEGATASGVSPDTLALLARDAREHGYGAFEAGLHGAAALEDLPAEERATVSSFCAWLQSERGELSSHSISALLERALARSGYRERLLALGSGERGIANLNKLLRLARRFEAREGRELRSFLDHVAYLKHAARNSESEAPVEGTEPDAVRLMSIHAAKGLEFPVVCVADLGRAANLRVPELLVDGARIGLNLASLDGSPSVPALDYEQLSAERRREEAEEEDRIVYVAMTRARELLLLSGAVELESWPEQRPGASALSWIGPALREDLPARLARARQEHRTELELEIGERGAKLRCLIGAPYSAQLLRTPDLGCAPQQAPAVGEQLTLAIAGGNEPAAAALSTSAAPPNPAALPGGADTPEAAAPPEAAALPEAAAAPEVVGPPEAADTSEVAAPPAAAGFELPAALSFSSLDDLERCGYRYYLERVLRLPQEQQPPARRRRDGAAARLQARERGTLVHRLLEQLDFARAAAPEPRGSAPTGERVQQLARELGLRVGSGEAQELSELLGAALRAQPARRAAQARNVRREYPFAFELGGRGADEGAGPTLLSGVIDLLASEPDGGALVLDYKSNALRAGEDLEALAEREYSLQREIYALAVLLTGAPHVEIVHWFLERPEEHIAVRYAARQRGSLEGLLKQRMERVSARGYAVSAQPHRALCASCPGRAGLCSWGPDRTLAELPQSP